MLLASLTIIRRCAGNGAVLGGINQLGKVGMHVMCPLEQKRLPCVIMRGGTSKAVFLLENDLPSHPARRDKVILAVFGSPDPRQIDGLGGADPLTSKLAIIGPPSRDDADVDYTFGQVELREAMVDYSSNCGNISSAVGPFAIRQGFVRAREPVTTVRVHNTNTGKVFTSEVPVRDGAPLCSGTYQIAGVPGTGAEIKMNLAGTVGSKTGQLLPTGNPKDILCIDGFGELEVSMVDAASPMVFVRAGDLGLSGTETPAQIDADAAMLALLEQIRARAAEKMGIVRDWKEAVERVRAVPMVAFVAPPAGYRSFLTGEEVSADTVDFVARDMFMQIMHKTYSGTAAVCTGCAAVTPGTIVNESMRQDRTGSLVRIGHPGGVIGVEMETARAPEGGLVITRAAIGRTARRILEGYVFVDKSLFD